MNILADVLGGEGALGAILAAEWVEPAAGVARALSLTDTRTVVDASNAFAVAGQGTCWLILSGAVDLLWAEPEGRVFLARVEAGGLIDAMTEADGDSRVVAIPSEDTEIVTTTRAALRTYAGTEEGREPVKTLFAGWVEGMTAAIGADAVQPESPNIPESKADAGWEAPLNALNACAVAVGQKRLHAAREARVRRAVHTRERTEERFAGRLDDTARLVDNRKRVSGGLQTTLNETFQLLYRAIGAPGEPKELISGEDESEIETIQALARNNNLLSRTVTLEDGWWKGDHGPLLGFTRDERHPLALVPRPGGGYEVATPRGPQVVGPQFAATIDPIAHVFMTALPQGKLSPWRLFKFSLFGASRDVRHIIYCLLLSGLFSLVTPIAIGWLMSPIIPSAELTQVAVIGTLLLVVAAASTMTGVVQSLASLRLEGQMENRVESAVWIRILTLPAPFFRTYTAGDLANRADSIDGMRATLGQAASLLLASSVGVLFSFGLMVYYDWRVAVVAFLVAAVFGLFAIVLGRYILSYNQRTLDLTGKIQGIVLQMVGAIGKLRVAGAERRAFLRWLNDYRELTRLSMRQRILNNRLVVVRALFPYLSTIAVLATIGIQMKILFEFFDANPSPVPTTTDTLSTAAFISFNVALGQFTAAMFSAARGTLYLYMLHPLYNRVRPILDAEPEEHVSYGHLTKVDGDIALSDVTFRYTRDGPVVLRNVTFTAPKGKMTAIVGPSGAGKSSIVRLLLGFETPESGSVYVDGNDIRFVNQWDLRRFYGVVLQDGSLLSGSVYDNVAGGIPYTMDEVEAAVVSAGLGEELKSWPMGLNTQVGDGSAVISRGQRQRLMIARAILRKPKILILDEATSALDNVTQAFVTENLKAMQCTQVVIAHRLSTIVDADKIVVLDAGAVAEEGTYKELMEKKGIFARLVERQVQ